MKKRLTDISQVIAWTTFAFVLILVIKSVASHPLSSDSFLHLAVGKYIALFQHIPSHYDLSYKTADVSLSWMSYAWLADILLYGSVAANLGAMSIGISLLSLIFCIGILLLLFNEFQFSSISKALSLSIVLFLLQIYWRVHPLLLIAPLLLLTLLICLRYGKKKFGGILFLPLIGIVWANIYGGYIFIFFTALISFFIWHIISYSRNSGRRTASLALVIFISIIASFLNPYTWHIYEKTFTFLGVIQLKRAFVNESNLLSLINQSFLLENVSTIPYAVHALFLVFISISIPLLAIRKRYEFFNTYSITLITAPLLIFGFLFVRLIPLTLLAAAILFCALIEYLRSQTKYFDYGLLVFFCGAIPYLAYQLFFPFKLLTIHSPTRQIELIQKYNLPRNVMTTSEFTGYAKYMLPDKLNIDLLDEIYDDAETLNVLLQSGTFTKETLKQILDDKHIGTVLSSKENGNFSRSMQISLRDEWALIYIDTNGVLFVRRNKVSPEFLKQYEMRYLSLASTLGADKDRLPEATAELEYALKLYPYNNLYRGQLATLYRIQKHPEKAMAVLYAIPQDQWDYKLYTEMGRAQVSMGNCVLAERFLQQALNERTETNFSQAVLDLALVYVGCFQDKKRARHYFERYLSFTIPHTEKEKARKLADDFGIHIE